MSKLRHIGLRVYLAVLGGIWMSLCPVFEVTAQDRPAVARPSKTKESNTPKKEDSSKTDDKNSADAEGTGTGPSANIAKILPEGRTLKGVKLPSYTGDRLSSLMTADTMERLDEKHLGMDELQITMYAGAGEADTLISTDRGVYDLVKEEITSDTRTLIEQEGVFDLEGDSMIFDANTQKGRMTGNVKMLLYQARKNLMGKGTDTETDQGKEKEGNRK